MNQRLIDKIEVVELAAWTEPIRWPRKHEFCVACIIDKASIPPCKDDIGPHEVVESAMVAGARAIYWWGAGKNVDHLIFSAADGTLFSRAYHIATGKMRADKAASIFPYIVTDANIAVEFMLSDMATYCCKNAPIAELKLIIIGLKGSLSMKKFRRDMTRKGEDSWRDYAYTIQNEIQGKSHVTLIGVTQMAPTDAGHP